MAVVADWGSETRDAEQLVLLERMARGASLSELLESIVTLVERQSHGMLCSILLLDAEQRLRHGAAPSLPAEYCRAIDGSAIGPAAGSCGTAAYSRQPVVVEDIETHPYWSAYKHLALPHGLRACWSSPILAPDGEVLGTFAMYFRQTRSPTAAELKWVAAATHLAAVSIDRHRTMQALESAERRARHLARLYSVSSSVGAAMVRIRDPHALYEQACRIAVEHGLARLAWVGLYDAEADRIVPVARCGEDRGYVDSIVLNLRDADKNRGPAARALATGACALSNDLADDPGFRWRKEAVARGLRACAVFPLKVAGATVGILAMYADRPHFFGAEECKVLGALADNIAFAVASVAAESEKQRLMLALTERVKEATLLHSVASLLHAGRPARELLAEVVAAIPGGMQFPARCAARIAWRDLAVSTPNWRGTPPALAERIDADGQSGMVEVAYVDDGETGFLDEERHVIRSIAGMLSTCFAREAASEARRRSEERLRAVIENTPNVGIQWFDRAGRVLFCNRASTAMFGWNPARALGKRLDELNFPAAEAARFDAAIARVAATGAPAGPLEFNYRRPDGSDGTLLSTIFRIPYGDGEHCYVCMDVDLTERNRMAENVRAAERLHAAILNSVVDGIFYLAVEPDGRFRFVAVNPAFLAATGFARSDVVGRTANEVWPESSRRLTLAQFAEAVASAVPVSWEEAASYPAGLRHGEITVAPIVGTDGRCTHLVGTVHDITERKHGEEERRSLEAELQKAQRLEALGTLAGGVAHDFNNILTVIAGNAALGLAEAGPGSGAAHHLEEVRRAAERATALVRQLLTFGRGGEARRESVDVGRVIEETVGMLRATLPAGVDVRTSIDAATPAALADPTQLHQIVLNLTTNAIQALGDEGGLVEVGVEPHEGVDPAQREGFGRRLRIRVRDNGCGMTPATAARIFEPFFTTKGVGRGTGLGLSVVHRIVKSHGGSITVSSEPGRGTEFLVSLPAVAPDAAASPARGPHAHVLYVDDDEALGHLITRVLERFGYRVTAVTDPLVALRDFAARPAAFQAVVTDVSMGGMSGIDLARELRAIRPDLPIVVTSGYLRDEVIEVARSLGVEVILKPNTVAELGSTLHRLLPAARPTTA